MADEFLPHIRISDRTKTARFQSTKSNRRSRPAPRNLAQHGGYLLQGIGAVHDFEAELEVERRLLDLPPTGIPITLKFLRSFYDYSKMEWVTEGWEVLSVSSDETFDYVTIFVPDGRLTALESRLAAYMKGPAEGKENPTNATLFDAMESIGPAAFAQFWTDDSKDFPGEDAQWFQVWLRYAEDELPKDLIDKFTGFAVKLDIEVGTEYTRFPGRIVVSVYATRPALEKACKLLDLIAEVRSVNALAEFFEELPPAEQADWVNSLLARLKHTTDSDSSYITLMDTGVNNGHPLLKPVLDDKDMYSVNPKWLGPADDSGHGTEVAGIAVFGNLPEALASSGPISIRHRMESVKIFSEQKGKETPEHLYGAVTQTAAYMVETEVLDRTRTFVMTVTEDKNILGLPSEWSAVVDQLTYGVSRPQDDGDDEDGEDEAEISDFRPRLFVLAAGNVPVNAWLSYPSSNALYSVQSPAQAWNSVAVGACTYLTDFDQVAFPNHKAIAEEGLLSPSSTTSIKFKAGGWPIKPDVVAEGGNASIESKLHVDVGPHDLRLLTTSHEPLKHSFAITGDTSAAAGEVARLAAHLRTQYPDYWPESVRALIIHGATHHPKMVDNPVESPGKQWASVLKRYGFGAIDWNRSLSSLYSRPTMVVEGEIQPFRKETAKGKSGIRLGHIDMISLPWPKAALVALGEAEVRMKVTLSYFVEPNPSRRGWVSKYKYAGHGLRFAIKAAVETDDQFHERINKLERDEDHEGSIDDPDRNEWVLGYQLRTRGSIHSDTWEGTAVALSEKSHFAIYPVGGWWKDWKKLNRYNYGSRYALVVSLEIAEGAADLYTPIALEMKVPIKIET